MTDIPALKLKNQVCHSLYSATNALIRAYRPILDQLGLTYAQYLVMLALWDEDGVMIKSLVVKSSNDSRQKLVVLTAAGKHLADRAKKIPDNIKGQINMPAQDVQQLKALAEQLYTLINTNIAANTE